MVYEIKLALFAPRLSLLIIEIFRITHPGVKFVASISTLPFEEDGSLDVIVAGDQHFVGF